MSSGGMDWAYRMIAAESLDALGVAIVLHLGWRDAANFRTDRGIARALNKDRASVRRATEKLAALGVIVRLSGQWVAAETVAVVKETADAPRPDRDHADGKAGASGPRGRQAPPPGASGPRKRGRQAPPMRKENIDKARTHSAPRPATCAASPAKGQAAHIAAKAKPVGKGYEGTGEITGPSWGDLSSFQRSAIAKGEAVFLPQGRRYVQPGDVDYRQWVEAHRCEREGLTVAQAAGVL